MNPVPKSPLIDKSIGAFRLGETTALSMSPFLRANERSPDNQKKRIILVAGCGNESVQLITRCLTKQDHFEILKITDFDFINELIESLSPELIIMGTEALNICGPQPLIEFASSDTPLVLVSGSKLSESDRSHLLSDGAIDCLDMGIGEAEFGFRLRAALDHKRKLNGYLERVARIEAENMRLARDYENLKQEVASKRRESIAHLELLIHSKGVKESLLDKIYDLKPYLNLEGKSKLNHIAKQMKWELTDEEELNLERKLDECNHNLYELLDQKSVGLTRYEKRLCAYFITNHSSASIARLARKNSNCINVAFARIRSKLGVPNNKELKQYLEDLVAADTSKEIFMNPV